MDTIIEHAKTNEDLDSLSEEFSVWLESNGLPEKSADELLLDTTTPLDDAQRIFLTEFCRRWEVAALDMGVEV